MVEVALNGKPQPKPRTQLTGNGLSNDGNEKMNGIYSIFCML